MKYVGLCYSSFHALVLELDLNSKNYNVFYEFTSYRFIHVQLDVSHLTVISGADILPDVLPTTTSLSSYTSGFWLSPYLKQMLLRSALSDKD